MATAVVSAPLCVLFLCLSLQPSRGLFNSGTDGYRRKVSLEFNPGLNSSPAAPPGVNVLHVRAVGPSDTLHFIWGSQGAPTLLLIHTNSSNSSLHIDWQRMLSSNSTGSLWVEPETSVQYSSALVFTRIWEYSDDNDTADPSRVPSSSFFPAYDLADFAWDDLNRTLNRTTLRGQLCGRNSSDPAGAFANGSVCLEISAFEAWGRDAAWPRLLHSANSSQLRLVVSNVTERANQSRFALEMVAVTGRGHQSRVDTLRSIDDENTPSIFQVSQWVTMPANASAPVLSFAQWKPVAYRSQAPVFEDATPVRHSALLDLPIPPDSGLVRAFFGDQPSPGYQAVALNVSFGITGDPFYNATRFLSWTVMLGLGSPPQDFFSVLVQVIMVVALGTPLLLLLVGGLYVCLGHRKQAPGYAPIN
ncbi:GLMP protein, partial [Atractosteus spatula]|nr:GLMP protein [Atractosteus spatula]